MPILSIHLYLYDMWCGVVSLLLQWVASTPIPSINSRSEDLHLRATAPNSLDGGYHEEIDYGPVIRVGPRRKEHELEEDEDSCVTTLTLTSEQMATLEPLKVHTVPPVASGQPHYHAHGHHPKSSSRTSFNQQLVSIVASYSQPPSSSTAGRTFQVKPKPRLKKNFIEPVDNTDDNYGNIDQGPFLEQLRMVRMRRVEITQSSSEVES